MTIKSSEQYLQKAASLAARAEQQGQRAEVMATLTGLARLNIELHNIVLQRETAGLSIPATAEPVAFLDAHDQLWERQEDGGAYHCKATGATAFYEMVQSMFGPLRPAEVSR